MHSPRRPPLVDYQARRDHLSDWQGIDSESWLYLRPKRRRTDRPARRAHASIWLWCELTSGHEQATPSVLPGRHEHVLHDQAIFKRRFLASLRERLLILGELLLATPVDSRSTLPVQLAAALRAAAA